MRLVIVGSCATRLFSSLAEVLGSSTISPIFAATDGSVGSLSTRARRR
jgi:hypothetical protein